MILFSVKLLTFASP